MNKKILLSTLTSLFIFGFQLQGLSNPNSADNKNNSPGLAKYFNTDTIENLKGTISNIDYMDVKAGFEKRIILTLKTEKESINVFLGPVSFFEKHDMKFNINEKIELRGSRASYFFKTFIIATNIKKGSNNLKLRDDKGNPFWSLKK